MAARPQHLVSRAPLPSRHTTPPRFGFSRATAEKRPPLDQTAARSLDVCISRQCFTPLVPCSPLSKRTHRCVHAQSVPHAPRRVHEHVPHQFRNKPESAWRVAPANLTPHESTHPATPTKSSPPQHTTPQSTTRFKHTASRCSLVTSDNTPTSVLKSNRDSRVFASPTHLQPRPLGQSTPPRCTQTHVAHWPTIDAC